MLRRPRALDESSMLSPGGLWKHHREQHQSTARDSAALELRLRLDELHEAVRSGRQLIGFNAVRGAYRLRLEDGDGSGAGTWATRSRL